MWPPKKAVKTKPGVDGKVPGKTQKRDRSAGIPRAPSHCNPKGL